jgi:hypothetical protein
MTLDEFAAAHLELRLPEDPRPRDLEAKVAQGSAQVSDHLATPSLVQNIRLTK